ncbi:hypothetical protein KFL_000480020 [Klebsormidium nitens]|uniref:Reverse transcriptase Ty1/copia-type domain-containing protein n=1 Tax=Klebsormidium nitens TaxID=105231 RepID=A0A1Y1HNE3_KLENI|nr:hypothetical protein KFL_000480020 [Klebsormidium nitens]|eukprot:GAQ80160.1 hypothetical protein KFL_000480020 [Klebsormidium nitens]
MVLAKARIDFEEVYAFVSKHINLRALQAAVVERDLELHQLDVKTAFLNGDLEEEIYVQGPQGYEQGGPNVVPPQAHLVRVTPSAACVAHALKEGARELRVRGVLEDAALFSGVVNGERVYPIVHCRGTQARPRGHWVAALGVVRYLVGTAEAGITFGESGEVLEAFHDADYAGYVFLMYAEAVSWSSRFQPTVAASTVESEYMSAGQAVKEALWFRKLGGDLGLDLGTVKIYCDNQGTTRLFFGIQLPHRG